MPTKYNPAQAMARLLLGSVVIGIETFEKQLRLWEAETTRVLSQPAEEDAIARSTPPDAATTLRYAMLGALLEAQRRLPRQGWHQIERHTNHSLHTLLHNLETNPDLAPLREQFNRWLARGEHEVNRWIEQGRAEELRSRAFVETAARVVAQTSIHEVTQNEEVRELVQRQSVGLANEVVEEVREHTISLDLYVERLVRGWFGLDQREAVPESPFAAVLHGQNADKNKQR
ncbi:MAG: hypothetical protein HC876_00605 [Chloroflexaceae bacterium]|nr:hypothetical protein [Chloroflexaceae bacterium]NJO04144.1 hypothetical protein [Chloroflexaceae bacterium]